MPDINVSEILYTEDFFVDGYRSVVVRYVDFELGSDANNGTTWALAKKTLGSASSGLSGRENEIRVAKSAAPSAIGNATFTERSATITLAAARTITVDDCEAAWTPSLNVTHAADTTYFKQGTASRKFTFGFSFTTGLAAYKALPAPVDFSSKDAITFWIRLSVTPNATANMYKVCLCSDVAGAVIVDNFTIPWIIPFSATMWMPITLKRDGGGALGNAIQSVAIYCNADPSANVINIDNIEACTYGDISLTSIIGRNDGFWYTPKSIIGTTVIIAARNQYGANAEGTTNPYGGASETATLYALYGIPKPRDTSGNTEAITASNIRVIGGFNKATDRVDGMTWMDGLHSVQGNMISVSAFSATSVNNFGFIAGFVSLVDTGGLGTTYYCSRENLSFVSPGNLGISLTNVSRTWYVGTKICCASPFGTNICSVSILTKALGVYFEDFHARGLCNSIAIDNTANSKQVRINGFSCFAGFGVCAFVRNQNPASAANWIVRNGHLKGLASAGSGYGFLGTSIDSIHENCIFDNISIPFHFNGHTIRVSINRCVFRANCGPFDMGSASPFEMKIFINDCVNEYAAEYFGSSQMAAFAESLFGEDAFIAITNDTSVGQATKSRVISPAWESRRDAVNYRTSSPCTSLRSRVGGSNNLGLQPTVKFKAPMPQGQDRVLKIYLKRGASVDPNVSLGVVINKCVQFMSAPFKVTTSYLEYSVTLPKSLALHDGICELVVKTNPMATTDTDAYKLFMDDFSFA